MIDQMVYHWAETFLGIGVVKGRCLNIGLGPGTSARLMLQSRVVDSVHSVEIDPKVISAYKATYQGDPLEAQHTIFEQDIRTMTKWDSLYDFALLDIEFADQDWQQVMTNIGRVLDKNGALVVETLPRETVTSGWLAKKTVDPISILWDYLNANWQMVETRPALSPTGLARAGSMRYLLKIGAP